MDGHNRNYRGGGGRHRHQRRGGRGGRHRHQPYNSRGPRGPPRQRNRFGGGQKQVDPETLMLRQVASFVSRAGELKNIKESSMPELRPVESTTAANINDLTAVLCAQDKVDMLLKFRQPASDTDQVPPIDKVGKLVHLVVSCAAGLPLQTPCYAALTVSVHEQVKGTQWEGFAGRCVEYALLNIMRDVDAILFLDEDRAQSACRAKLLLRYLAILTRIGVVKPFDGYQSNPIRLTMFSLLTLLIDLATAAIEKENNSAAAGVMVFLVLSTLPYVTSLIPSDSVADKLLKPIEAILQKYKSTFSPGSGLTSILLKDEQLEDDEDEEVEDDEEDEDDDTQGQICDSLQDLLRACQTLTKGGESSRFCLPIDSPWKGLIRRSTPNPESGESESHPVSYSEAPIFLSFQEESHLIGYLVRGDSQFKMQCFSLEGIVFGRLPIFGSPPDLEDEEEMEALARKSAQHQAYDKGYGLLDRYFIAETVRDCLISHESNITGTGLEQGGAKSAAEELLSLPHAFTGVNPSFGFEYAIVENILALISQTTDDASLSHGYLSRVLLELTRLDPGRFSPALAMGMMNLFQDYLPALVPNARENLSCWFAYHLINTEYQWPSAYWQLWEPFVTSSKPSSRGSFVRRAINLMAENESDPYVVASSCFPTSKGLASELIGRTRAPIGAVDGAAFNGDTALGALQADVMKRVWDDSQDASLLSEYLSSNVSPGNWSRTDVLIRVLMNPAGRMLDSIKDTLQSENKEDQMVEDESSGKDAHVIITDAIIRYKQTLIAAIAKDAESLGASDDSVILGGAFLLQRVEMLSSFNSSLLEGIVSCLVRHKVVSSFSVLQWVLLEGGESSGADVVPRWWCYATDSIRETIAVMEEEKNANGGMTIDGGNMNSNEEFASQVVTHLSKALSYAVQRTCTLLSTNEKDLNSVDLLEGMKYFASRSKSLVVAAIKRAINIEKAVLNTDVEALFAKFNLSGASLAEICPASSYSAVALLKLSLQTA